MRLTALSFAALMTLAGGALQAQDIAGDWQGILKAGGAELHVVLHISNGAGGGLKATLDSVDQGALGIAVEPVSFSDSKLIFAVPAVHGTYQGAFQPAANTIEGTWLQAQPLPLVFHRAAPALPSEHKTATSSDIDGPWWGTLDAPQGKLRIVFRIANGAEGLTATAESPDQGGGAIPVSSITRNGPAVKMELKQFGGGFEGKISADLSTIDGEWKQGPGSLPLVLKRLKDKAELDRRRPQNPAKPYPYREEEVAFENKPAGIRLGGTLTIPQGKGPYPAVLLITGSGQQDRDESIMGHKPFLVLADHLTRKGIAVLRVDDRGIGKSGGNFAASTTADFATDAEAGFAYLKTRTELNPAKLGLIGHSEGGMIAPVVASRNADVAFIVMMAGPGVRGDEILSAQVAAIAEAGGEGHETAQKRGDEEREILALVEHEQDDAAIEAKLRGKVPEGQIKTQVKELRSPWFRYFLEYDPADALSKTKCPVLAVIGEKDRQVPPGQNLPEIRKALEGGGNKHFEVDEMPGLNHLFQTAKTGSPGEYAEIEETMSPDVLEKISAWISKQ